MEINGGRKEKEKFQKFSFFFFFFQFFLLLTYSAINFLLLSFFRLSSVFSNFFNLCLFQPLLLSFSTSLQLLQKFRLQLLQFLVQLLLFFNILFNLFNFFFNFFFSLILLFSGNIIFSILIPIPKKPSMPLLLFFLEHSTLSLLIVKILFSSFLSRFPSFSCCRADHSFD